MTTGEKISEQRKLHKMSQADLAEKVGVTRSVIIKWESDIYCPSPANADKLSELFGVPFCYLFDECVAPSSCAKDCGKIGVELLREINAANASAIERYKRENFLRKKRGITALLAVLCAISIFATACLGIIVFPDISENTSSYVTSAVVTVPHFIMSLVLSATLAAALLAVIFGWKEAKN